MCRRRRERVLMIVVVVVERNYVEWNAVVVVGIEPRRY